MCANNCVQTCTCTHLILAVVFLTRAWKLTLARHTRCKLIARSRLQVFTRSNCATSNCTTSKTPNYRQDLCVAFFVRHIAHTHTHTGTHEFLPELRWQCVVLSFAPRPAFNDCVFAGRWLSVEAVLGRVHRRGPIWSNHLTRHLPCVDARRAQGLGAHLVSHLAHLVSHLAHMLRTPCNWPLLERQRKGSLTFGGACVSGLPGALDFKADVSSSGGASPVCYELRRYQLKLGSDPLFPWLLEHDVSLPASALPPRGDTERSENDMALIGQVPDGTGVPQELRRGAARQAAR